MYKNKAARRLISTEKYQEQKTHSPLLVGKIILLALCFKPLWINPQTFFYFGREKLPFFWCECWKHLQPMSFLFSIRCIFLAPFINVGTSNFKIFSSIRNRALSLFSYFLKYSTFTVKFCLFKVHDTFSKIFKVFRFLTTHSYFLLEAQTSKYSTSFIHFSSHSTFPASNPV